MKFKKKKYMMDESRCSHVGLRQTSLSYLLRFSVHRPLILMFHVKSVGFSIINEVKWVKGDQDSECA